MADLDQAVVTPSPAEAPVTALPEGWEPYQGETVTPSPSEPATPEGWEPYGGEIVTEPEIPSITDMLVDRFFGTDVREDKLDVSRMGAVLAGSVAAGSVGARIPPAPGPAGLVINPLTGGVTFAAGGALLGAIFPETAIELAEAMGALPEGTRDRVGLSDEDLLTVARGEVLLEVATGGTLTVARLAGRGFTSAFTGLAREGRSLAETASLQKIMLMPVQVGNGRIARGYVSIMGRFPWVGSAVVKRGRASEEAIRSAVEGMPLRVGPISTWSDISNDIFSDARILVKDINDSFGARYAAVFARAEELGTTVVPQEVAVHSRKILGEIAKASPATVDEALGGAKEIRPGAAVQPVVEFIEKELLPLQAVIDGSVVTAKQSLAQMDTLVSKIDQAMSLLEPSQKKFAMKYFQQLRQSALLDMTTNLRGVNADAVGAELRTIDEDFSHTMSQLFETATAKRVASVRRRGLTGIAADEATRIHVDQLSRSLINLASPQSVEELARIVTPDTFKKVAAAVVEDGIEAATRRTENGNVFLPDVFAKHFGLGSVTSNKRTMLARLLQESGSPLGLDEIDSLVGAARAIADTEIPNVSSFIARRATIGGLSSLRSAFTLGVAGGLGVGVYGGQGLLSFALFLGGARMLSKMIANPTSARHLKSVMDVEATTTVRRGAVIDAVRLTLEAMRDDGDISPDTFGKLQRFSASTIDAIDRQIQDALHP